MEVRLTRRDGSRLSAHPKTGRAVRCLGLLASHRGSNALTVIKAAQRREIPIKVGVVIGNNPDAPVLAGARELGVPAIHLNRRTHPDPAALDEAIITALRAHEVDLVLLVGYFRPLGNPVLRAFPDQVLNLHPSLVPGHTGAGMIGRAVHEDVLRTGDPLSGVTLHLVGRPYIPGPVVRQSAVPVRDDDTPESLERRIIKQEHRFVVECLRDIASGQLPIPVALGSASPVAGPSAGSPS